MRKYYIVTQADTDENGHFQYANGVANCEHKCYQNLTKYN